jgi:hypothetical protein
LIGAFECKHRPISLDDIRHGVAKAERMGLSEYIFIAAAGLAEDQAESIRGEILRTGERADVLLMNILEVAGHWAAILNPIRRRRFGDTVARILREDMHRREVADAAAELWNSL